MHEQPPHSGSANKDPRSGGTVNTIAKSKNKNKNVVIEFACSPTSALGVVGSAGGFSVHRLSLDVADLTTDKGLKYAKAIVSDFPGCSLHGSLPCTPWTLWNFMNVAKYGESFKQKLDKSRNKSIIMLSHFFLLAKDIIRYGGHVSFEWPRFSTGWALAKLQKWITKHHLLTVDFDGCSLGVKSRKGRPIKKPWRIVTTNPELVRLLKPHRCKHDSSEHDPCAGADTKDTGFYTPELATILLKGLTHVKAKPTKTNNNKHASSKLVSPAAVVSPRSGGAGEEQARTPVVVEEPIQVTKIQKKP